MTTIEWIALAFTLINAAGWCLMLEERRSNRLISEEHLNLARVQHNEAIRNREQYLTAKDAYAKGYDEGYDNGVRDRG